MSKISQLSELPKVGDILYKIPYENYGCPEECPVRCTVTYVNKEHSWYEVEYATTHFKESFKVPEKIRFDPFNYKLEVADNEYGNV